MRVCEAPHRADETAAGQVRRVRVTLAVGVLVMTAVQRHPRDDRALARHGTEDGEHRLHCGRRRESAVGEQPVITHGHPEPGDQPSGEQQGSLGPAEGVHPQKRHRRNGPDDRCDVEEQEVLAL